mmetsp:Transcript_24076/g.52048  ORF Transcript_24076/g.52048 Transcript_24076/m.52048 type:complete len:85 (+) Transcript_24076:304-558(+)
MDISLLLEPQAKHQRMYRGNSMYSEQSLVEFKAISRVRNAKSSSAHKTRVKRKSVVNKKRPVFNSAEAHNENNSHLIESEKNQA